MIRVWVETVQMEGERMSAAHRMGPEEFRLLMEVAGTHDIAGQVFRLTQVYSVLALAYVVALPLARDSTST
jgi:hypothetical protein